MSKQKLGDSVFNLRRFFLDALVLSFLSLTLQVGQLSVSRSVVVLSQDRESRRERLAPDFGNFSNVLGRATQDAQV